MVAYVGYLMVPIAFSTHAVSAFSRIFAIAVVPFFGYLAWRGVRFVSTLLDQSYRRRC